MGDAVQELINSGQGGNIVADPIKQKEKKFREEHGGSDEQFWQDMYDLQVEARGWSDVSPTGQALSGWESSETGEISLDPNQGFGASSIPLWGDYAAATAKKNQGIQNYDDWLASGGEGAYTGNNVAEGGWVAVTEDQVLEGARLDPVMSNGEQITFTDDNGETRLLFQKVSKRDKYGIMGEDMSESLPGTVKDMIGMAVLSSDPMQGSIGTQAVGGSEMREGTFESIASMTGGDAEDIEAGADIVPQIASAVVAAYVSALWWLPGAVKGGQYVAKGAVAEQQNLDLPKHYWEEAAWDTALTLAASSSNATGSAWTRPAVSAIRTYADEGSLTDALGSAVWSVGSSFAGKEYGTTGSVLMSAAEGIYNDKDTSQILLDVALDAGFGELNERRREGVKVRAPREEESILKQNDDFATDDVNDWTEAIQK